MSINMRVQATLNPVSGVAADAAVNVWHFLTDEEVATPALVEGALTDFYNGVRAAISPSIKRTGGLTLKFYDLADPQPRVPFRETLLNITNTSVPLYALPAENSLCLSFQGQRVSGESQARRRGRIYLGPLGYSGAEDWARPSAGLISLLATAGDTLLAASDAQLHWNWAVWSTVNAEMTVVTDGWVDNAWDTQRRRGLEYTSRSTFT